MDPQFPIYILSKGRADSRKTVKALESQNVDFTIVVEEKEFDNYAAVIDPKKIVILDPKYQEDYDTFDDLGDTKPKGAGPARNFIWQHSIDRGFDWHWIMDDNINDFYRLNRNLKVRMRCGAAWKAMEDFVLRYQNVGMAGPNYEMFVPRKGKVPPFIPNTRIYSCQFIRNSLPFRWRGRYNEDTDLSLRILKAGLCTIQFNAFLQDKVPTQTVKGGNTDDFYAVEGTYEKSRMIVNMHPDVTRLVKRFGRWHHHVDYSVFKSQKLIRRDDLEIQSSPNEYGMVLRDKKKKPRRS